jgi:serine/threonine-protein kinase
MASCPACTHAYPEGSRFCPSCAAPLDASSAATVAMGAAATVSSAPRVSLASSVDEGRFPPGTVVAGRYRIADLLGRGGMGEVYRATDLTLGQAVALKFLPEATSQDERALARFYNEVRIARQVTHPNVCRVYDVGQVENLHYISMEFIDGEDLGSLLRRIGRLPVDKAVETARKLCAGLAAAHEKGVLHRDLKPANVMIDGRGQVIIMDFGLAGLAGQLQDVRSGTPAYMSPEQLAGTEVTARSDIYALGLLLYEVFTGRRTFEASSIIELIEMQDRAAPASITSVAKDLDPAVERLILRCLQPDPRKRPPSALAVAAALPGGDPLAAALAAGETPSPELVAAAGETEGLAIPTAVAWLAAAVVGLVVTIAISPGQSITSRLNLENPPEALSRDARRILNTFGYTTKPADTAWGLDYDSDYRKYSATHPKKAAARWARPAAGQPPLVHFWYRESPQPLTPSFRFNVAASDSDPPMLISGMIRLRTDPDGKLTSFDAVPPQVEKPPAPGTSATPFGWNRLFEAAGLDAAAFQPAEPTWTPLANWDVRAAWTGTDAATGEKLRLEAAAWRGRLVFFRIIGPWTVPDRAANASVNANELPVLAIIYLALAAACVLAWHNFRAGKTDPRGALRMFVIYLVCQSAVGLLILHHSATQTELALFWTAISSALLNGVLNWIFYGALEPWVRRKWPQTMISWSRYVSRGWRDPLVGRDLLYGVVLGLGLNLTNLLAAGLHGNSGRPMAPDLDPLLGVRWGVRAVIAAVPPAIFDVLLFFFLLFVLLFVLRLLLRREWIAAVVFVALLGFAVTLGTTTPAVDYPMAFVGFAIFAVSLLRYGLLATIIASGVGQLAGAACLLDYSAWYAPMAALPILVVAAMAVYGFRASLGGQRLFNLDA